MCGAGEFLSIGSFIVREGVCFPPAEHRVFSMQDTFDQGCMTFKEITWRLSLLLTGSNICESSVAISEHTSKSLLDCTGVAELLPHDSSRFGNANMNRS